MNDLRAGGDTAKCLQIITSPAKMQEPASGREGGHPAPPLTQEGTSITYSLGRSLTVEKVIQRIVRVAGLDEVLHVNIVFDRRVRVGRRPQ